MFNLFTTPLLAADTVNLSPTTSQFTSLGGITVPTIISGAITLVLITAATIFFFMLIYGGIKWIMSGGDKANTESARSTVTAALIGLVIVFAAWAIAQLFQTLFGVTITGGIELPTFTGSAG